MTVNCEPVEYRSVTKFLLLKKTPPADIMVRLFKLIVKMLNQGQSFIIGSKNSNLGEIQFSKMIQKAADLLKFPKKRKHVVLFW